MKQTKHLPHSRKQLCRPARVGGARIETLCFVLTVKLLPVAPPAWAGRGLKLDPPTEVTGKQSRPARVGGARIETKPKTYLSP